MRRLTFGQNFTPDIAQRDLMQFMTNVFSAGSFRDDYTLADCTEIIVLKHARTDGYEYLKGEYNPSMTLIKITMQVWKEGETGAAGRQFTFYNWRSLDFSVQNIRIEETFNLKPSTV